MNFVSKYEKILSDKLAIESEKMDQLIEGKENPAE
jgi:hypothetical protein